MAAPIYKPHGPAEFELTDDEFKPLVEEYKASVRARGTPVPTGKQVAKVLEHLLVCIEPQADGLCAVLINRRWLGGCRPEPSFRSKPMPRRAANRLYRQIKIEKALEHYSIAIGWGAAYTEALAIEAEQHEPRMVDAVLWALHIHSTRSEEGRP